MERKEILNDVLPEEIRDVVFLKFDARPENEKNFNGLSGIISELLAKEYDSSVPKNEDPKLALLEQIIITSMEQEGFHSPDIILMSYQNEGEIIIKEIGEIKLGFGEIERAIIQQTSFLPDLKKFLQNFEENIQKRRIVLSKQHKILLKDDCSLFYVLPKDASRSKEITSFQVVFSSFSYPTIRRIARNLARF